MKGLPRHYFDNGDTGWSSISSPLLNEIGRSIIAKECIKLSRGRRSSTSMRPFGMFQWVQCTYYLLGVLGVQRLCNEWRLACVVVAIFSNPETQTGLRVHMKGRKAKNRSIMV